MESFDREELLSLIERAKSKDREAISKIVKTYAPFIKKVVRYYGIFLDRSEREDLFLEGLLALLRVVSNYDMKKGPFENVLFVSVRNAVFDVISSRKRLFSNVRLPVKSEVDIEESLIVKDEIREFSKTLANVEKEVFRLYLKGLKIREIADKTGMSYKSVDNAIQRIKKKAANFIEKQ